MVRCALACAAVLALYAGPAPAQDELVGPPEEGGEIHAADFARLPAATPEAIEHLDFSTPVGTLAEALERSYWANPAVLAERARTRSVDYRLPQARALYGPSIDYQVTYGYQRDNLERPIGSYVARSGTSANAAAILSQPVFTFGRLAANERAAHAEIDFQRQTLRLTEQQVLYSAIAAYIGVLRDRAAVQIARDNEEILSSEFADTQARFDVRESTAADLEQVATRVGIARADLVSAEDRLVASEALFLAVIGSPPGDLAAPNPLRKPVETVQSARDFAQDQNPLLAAAHARERISRAAHAAAVADHFPRVDLQGRAEIGSQSPYATQPRQTTVLGQVVVSGPLFDSGLRTARASEARAANDADWRLIDDTGRELRSEVSSVWSAHLALRESAADLAEAVDAAFKAYEGALEQQRAGFRTTLDVLILARELLSVRNAYNATVAEAYLAEARLLLALGALDMAYLMPDSPRHDYREHYRRLHRQFELFVLTPAMSALDDLGQDKVADRPVRDPSLIEVEAGTLVVPPAD